MDRRAVVRNRVGILAIGALAIAMLVSPASGKAPTSPQHLWINEIRPRADVRYLQNSRVYISAPQSVGALGNATASVDCPTDMRAIGGGIDFTDDTATVEVVENAPLLDLGNLSTGTAGRNAAATGWQVSVVSLETGAEAFVVAAVCAK